MKKTIKPLTHPINLQITPRLLAAVEASAGRKVPPGARIMLVPHPIPMAFSLEIAAPVTKVLTL